MNLNTISDDQKLRISLLGLRLSIFFVMASWTLDKIFRSKHALMIYQDYYYLPDIGFTAMQIIGVMEFLILIGFVIGFKKGLSYALVLAFHSVSTIAPVYQYASGQLLFFAAFPMWAGCLTLFLLRHRDTLWTISRFSR